MKKEKRYTPGKYLLGVTLLYICLPGLIAFLALFIGGTSELAIGICVICALLVLLLPYVLVRNRGNASVIITPTQVTNHIYDGTKNSGWTEAISDIVSVELVGRERVRQMYAEAHTRKALLIDFGGGNVKYIAVGQFFNFQVKKIMRELISR